MEIEESDIIYDPNEDTKVALEDMAAAKELNAVLEKLHDISGVQSVYTNWSKGAVDDELWDDLRSKVAV